MKIPNLDDKTWIVSEGLSKLDAYVVNTELDEDSEFYDDEFDEMEEIKSVCEMVKTFYDELRAGHFNYRLGERICYDIENVLPVFLKEKSEVQAMACEIFGMASDYNEGEFDEDDDEDEANES